MTLASAPNAHAFSAAFPQRPQPIIDPHTRLRVVIMGAAGRDFHNFNRVYREDPGVDVVAFTTAQDGRMGDRLYPPTLAGPLYPRGIPIVDEAELEPLCRNYQVDQVVFAGRDIAHTAVMHIAARVLTTGADFVLLGPAHTMVQAAVPVIAVSAVRAGCGKAQVVRWLARVLGQWGVRVAVIQHPLPQNDLAHQRVQRFANPTDLGLAPFNLAEREAYEGYWADGHVVYTGLDYGAIATQAATEADLFLWDGGSNDFPFLRPDLHLVLVDALRPGQETSHHPGEAILRMADVAIVMKAETAPSATVQQILGTVHRIAPKATVVQGCSRITLDDPAWVQGKRVLVVEDGALLVPGTLPYGAGYVAATRAQAGEIVDPRPVAAGAIAQLYQQHPHLGAVLPLIDTASSHLEAIQQTLNQADVDLIISATPLDLASLVNVNKPILRTHIEYVDLGEPTLTSILEQFWRSLAAHKH